jgi:hypothetical protein
MPSINAWGPPTWTFFHTLAENIREEKFTEIKSTLFGIIKNICSFLPCPDCTLHAKHFLNKINIDKITNKQEFRSLLYLFHNIVNKKKNKPMYFFSHLQKYKSVNILSAFNHFVQVYNTHGNMNLMADTFHRGMLVKNIASILLKNIHSFHYPIAAPKEIVN